MRDDDAYIAFSKTMDPELQRIVKQKGGGFEYPVVSPGTARMPCL